MRFDPDFWLTISQLTLHCVLDNLCDLQNNKSSETKTGLYTYWCLWYIVDILKFQITLSSLCVPAFSTKYAWMWNADKFYWFILWKSHKEVFKNPVRPGQKSLLEITEIAKIPEILEILKIPEKSQKSQICQRSQKPSLFIQSYT